MFLVSFFFFKQKTAYEMRISDWSSDVCSSDLPQPVADPLCLTTTIYLEARDQPVAGQRAVAEVALRRADSGLWGNSVCAVVTAHKQFAPGIVNPRMRLKNPVAWATSARIAFEMQAAWALPVGPRIARDRKSVGSGQSVAVRVDHGGA